VTPPNKTADRIVTAFLEPAGTHGSAPGYTLDFGVGATAEAVEGPLDVLPFLRDTLWEWAVIFRSNITEGLLRRDIASLMTDSPEPPRDLIRGALERAKPRLLPEVDIHTTALMLQVVIAMPLLFRVPGVCETTPVESDRMLAAILRPLFREEKA
jgi:hypothetical protein